MAGPLSQAELAILVTGKDVSATRVMRGVGREADSFGRKLGAIGSKAGRNFARNLERTVIAGSAAAAGAIGYSLKVAGDFEAQLNTINTIAREDNAGLTAIGDGIRAMARDTGTPLEELTTGYYDLLSAGIAAADAQNVLTAANTLAIGGLATTAETVDLLTTAINTYGGDASKAGAYADMFAKSVERGKVTADQIAASFATIGPLAASNGIEISEIGAAYARLTAAGVPASEAATQMRSAIVGLMRTTAPLEKLQKATGKNYLQIAGKKGLVEALQQLRTDADKAGVPLIELLGRVEGVNFALQTTGPNFAAYNADLAAMDESAGTAAEQAAERQKGFNYQLQRLKANVQDAAITIGTELLPVFADLAEEGADWLRGHQPEIKKFAQDLAAGIRDAVEWARKLDWDAIARALGTGADAAKTIASVFMAMPPEMKGMLLGGYAVNKVTGGAVTDVIGLSIKTALGQFAMRGSSPANPLYVVPLGGMGGAGGAAGGAAGAAAGRFAGLGGLLRFAGVGIGAGAMLGSSAAGPGGSLSYEGAGGNIAGGALAGGALAGPLGALAGGLAGIVKSVQEQQSGMNTALAGQAHGNLTTNLATNPQTIGSLRTQLAAIDTGIDRITSNPLNVLVSGNALNELQAMRAEVVAAIDAVPPAIGGASLEERDALAAQRQAAEQTYTAVEGMRGAVVSAIRAQDLSVTVHMPNNNIAISVPPATLQRQIIRYQTGGVVRRPGGGGGGSHGGQGGHTEFG